VELIFERGGHAEVATPTSHGPEEIGLFVLACAVEV
jgi:hypothetical protein